MPKKKIRVRSRLKTKTRIDARTIRPPIDLVAELRREAQDPDDETGIIVLFPHAKPGEPRAAYVMAPNREVETDPLTDLETHVRNGGIPIGIFKFVGDRDTAIVVDNEGHLAFRRGKAMARPFAETNTPEIRRWLRSYVKHWVSTPSQTAKPEEP